MAVGRLPRYGDSLSLPQGWLGQPGWRGEVHVGNYFVLLWVKRGLPLIWPIEGCPLSRENLIVQLFFQQRKATRSLWLLLPTPHPSPQSTCQIFQFYQVTRHKHNWVLSTYLLRTRFVAVHCCFSSLPFHWFVSLSITKLFCLLSLPLSQSLNVLCGPSRNTDYSINTVYQTAHGTDNQIQPPGKHVFISCSHIWHS